MHKTRACLSKLGQADPRWQTLVLDPGLPPEQLLAPTRGRTLRQQCCSLSKCNEHVCHDYAGFNNIMLKKKTKLMSNLGFLGHTWLLVVYAYHSRFRCCGE